MSTQAGLGNEMVRVLLVGSNEDDHRLIHDLLAEAHGAEFELRLLQDFEAARAMTETEYDVCLLDDRIGDDGGLDLVRRTLAARPGAALLLLATREDHRADVDAMHAGVLDYLPKADLSPGRLERAVRYALNRRRAEAGLRHGTAAEQASLATAIANLSVGVMITDPRRPDNPLVFVNSAFTAITGYAPEEAVGRNPRFLQHPEADSEELRTLRAAVSRQSAYSGVLLNRRKDGTSYRNALMVSPVLDSDGVLVNFVGLTEDVTGRYEAQEALGQSERRFESTVANVPGMIYRARRLSDGTVEFLYVSEGSRALFGLGPEQFLADASALRRLVHLDDLASYESAGERANGAAQSWRWQGRFVLPSGEEKVILGLGHPEPHPDGGLVWDGLLTDVTDRMQAEEKMALLAAIVEGSQDAIKSKTLDGIVTSWNASAERMYGYTAEEMIGRPIARLLPPDRPDEVLQLLKRIARGEQVRSYETVRRAKDGTLLDVELTLSPIRDSSGRVTGASTIAQDIRSRKDAEAQIHRQMMRIQALRNIDMAITASLDLRVTLNVLLDQVTTHLSVDSAAILLLNPHTHRLEYTAGRGFRSNALQRTHLRLGEGYAGRAALERRVLTVPDLAHADNEFKRAHLIAGENFVSYWAAPLITKGRVEGVLEIFHRASLNGDSDWMNFLEALAGQAAIAIENAALFNDLQRSNVELQVAYDSTLEGWSNALDLRDKETEGHTQRVTEATMTLAHTMNIPDDDVIHMRRGALLHDIGKMGIPDSILLKPGPLTAEEWVIMKQHPVYAYELLSPIQFLRPSLDIPYCHHEKWDGSGYPRGLRGEQIPLSARLFAIVDVWDALRSDRPYRPAWPAARVRDHIAQGSGTHFAPEVIEVFLSNEI